MFYPLIGLFAYTNWILQVLGESIPWRVNKAARHMDNKRGNF